MAERVPDADAGDTESRRAETTGEVQTGLAEANVALRREIAERQRIERALQFRVELEKVIATISARFINLQPGEVDEGIRFALGSIAQLIGAERACIARPADGELLVFTHEWRAHTGEGSIRRQSTELGLGAIPWLHERLARFEVVHTSDVDSLPPEAARDREHLQSLGVRSLLYLPMLAHERLDGVVSFETFSCKIDWAVDVVGLLRLVAETFVNTLERKRAEVALRASEERLQTVVSNSPVVLFALDREGVITFSDGRGLATLGLAPGEHVGRSVFDVYHAVPAVIETARRALAGEAFRTTIKLEGRAFDCWQTPLRGARNELTGVISVATDVTDREQFEEALARSEERLRTVVSNAPVVLFALDRDGVFVFSEGRGLDALGLAPGEVVGRSVFDVYEDNAELLDNIRRALAGETFSATLKVARIAWESWYAPLRYADGRPDGVIGVAVDVTDRVRAEEALRVSEERYALAVRGANDGVWDWDMDRDQIYYSPRWKAMLGLAEDDPRREPSLWLDRIHPDDVERVRNEIDTHLSGRTAHFEAEHRVLHEDGTWRWVLSRGIALRDGSGRAYRLAGSQSDTTERKAAEARQLHDALHDQLTDLPNRNLFVERLEQAIEEQAARRDRRFAVLFLDLDRFKLVNDGLGHQAGDRLLVQVARRLVGCLRPADTIARLGGDEFSVLLPGIGDAEEIDTICDRIQVALHGVVELGGHEVFTTASIGVVLGDPSYSSPEELLRDADAAMFHSKARGRGRYVIFDRRMREQAVQLLRLENDLRRAVERREFVLEYQPIVDLADGRIGGFEALIRWEHPERGVVAPDDFITAAEDTGLMRTIGRWLLEEACERTRSWQLQYDTPRPLTISVNLSSREFSQPDLIDVVTGVLERTGLDPSALRLEITETLIMENDESVLDILARLKALGVLLSIDDFGTGHSSLSRLHRFPIDTFKIDRSFVSRIGTEIENPEIVQTIVSLARTLGMEVIAEGVESAAQVEHLRELGCEYGQGYFFARPQTEAGVAAMLDRGGPLPST